MQCQDNTQTFKCGTAVKIMWECSQSTKHSGMFCSSPIIGDKNKAVGILDYFIGAMCEIGGLNITDLSTS